MSTGKTFAKYQYTLNSLNDAVSPTTGARVAITDEIAIGDVRFNKFEAQFERFLQLLPSVAL